MRLKMPTSEEDLNLLVLKEDVKRNVKNIGINLTLNSRKYLFWSPVLPYHYKQTVFLGYNPEDLESVLIYCATTGKYICEAFNMRSENPRYTIDDVRSTRNQFSKGIKERMKEYIEEIEIEDRRASKKHEWDAAREEINNDISNKFEEEIIAEESQLLLNKFKRQDRSE